MIETFNIKERKFQCPANGKHHFGSLKEMIAHLKICEDKTLVKTQYFMCRFSCFHWFKSSRDRSIHESFLCFKKQIDITDQTIFNLHNDLFLPFDDKDAEQFRRFMTEAKPMDKLPNIINFYNGMKHNMNKIKQKKCIQNKPIIVIDDKRSHSSSITKTISHQRESPYRQSLTKTIKK